MDDPTLAASFAPLGSDSSSHIAFPNQVKTTAAAASKPSPQPPTIGMAPATALQDELAEEILLRIPPDDPALLVRAALVCKHSCRLIADPDFRRRFREFHGAPPMLGFFRNTTTFRANCRGLVRLVLGHGVIVLEEPSAFARFVSTSSLRLRRANWRRDWRVVDARHGRVLLLSKTPLRNNHFLVWDPITNEKRDLGILPGSLANDNFNAAVFCADAGCRHLDCRHNHFTVVYVSITLDCKMVDYIYSSEAVQWHLPSMPFAAAQQDGYLDLGNSILVGNLLYFVIDTNTRILEYNVATREMGVIHLPPGCSSERRIMLMTVEDGCLGFAIVQKSKLRLWSREIGSDKDAGWAQSRVINLNVLLPIRCLSTSPHVVGFANGIGVIFVGTRDGLFTIDLNSSRVKKVGKTSGGSRIFPYMSYCTPALRAATTSTGEEPTMGASSASEA